MRKTANGTSRLQQSARGHGRADVRDFVRSVVPRLIRAFPRIRKIVLFGSYATGRPGRDSDLDLLVVMPTRQRWPARIRQVQALFPERPVPLDIVVRTPREVQQRLTTYFCPFTREILSHGRVLYEARR